MRTDGEMAGLARMAALMRPGRSVPAAILLASLLGCGSNPQFNINSANQAYGSLNELYGLLAKAELGAFGSPASFAANLDSYSEVIGGFEVARMIDRRGKRRSAAANAAAGDDLDRAVAECVARVGQMAAVHRSRGIGPGSSQSQAARASCNAAARSVAANEASSLVINTVAGDL